MTRGDITEAPEPDDGKSGSTVLLTLSTFLVPLVGVLTGPLTARALGPLRRGNLASFVVWNEIGTSLFRFGVPDAVAYYDQQHVARARLWKCSVRIAQVMTLPALLVGAGVFAVLAPRSPVGLATLIGLSIVWSPLVDTLALVRLRLVVGSRDLRGLTTFNLIQPCLSGALVLSLFATGTLNLVSAVASVLAGQMAGYAYLYTRTAVSDPGGQPSMRPTALVRFGIKTLPSSLGEIINSRLDQVIMPLVLGASWLGIYAVAVGVSGLALRVGYALSQSEYARVGRAGASAREVAASSIRRSAAACIAVAVAIAVTAPFLIPILFGRAFDAAVVPCLILLTGTALSGANLVASNIANVLGFPGISSWSQVIGLVLTLALLYPAMTRFGIDGAAVVTTTAYVARYAATTLQLRRRGVPSMVPRWADFTWLAHRLLRRSEQASARG